MVDLVDVESGATVPYQSLELVSHRAPVPYAAGRYARGRFDPRERFDLLFAARDVPEMGYRTFRLAPRERMPSFKSSIQVGESSLENQFYRVDLDPGTAAAPT